MLNVMKMEKALDQIKQDGRISGEEFQRLAMPELLMAAAATAVKKSAEAANTKGAADENSDEKVDGGDENSGSFSGWVYKAGHGLLSSGYKKRWFKLSEISGDPTPAAGGASLWTVQYFTNEDENLVSKRGEISLRG